MIEDAEHDVVVIGAGVGGLFAGARLALAGRRPLVLESTERLGGRFSTIEKDGYLIPTGAIAIPAEGPFHETLLELGVDADLRIPEPSVRVRVRGREVTAGGQVWALLINKVTKSAGRVFDGLKKGELDAEDADLTIDQWVRKHTRSKTVGTLIQSIVASTFTVNSDELSARDFFLNLRETGTFKKYGFAPRGNVAIANDIAAAIEARGGEVRRGWTVTSVEVEEGRAVAVQVTGPDGEQRRITTNAVISNVGPVNTVELVAGTPFEAEMRQRVSHVQPTAMLSLTFSTAEDVMPKCPGLMEFTDTERLCMVGNLAALCPEVAPPGRSLYEAMSVPRPGLGVDFDVEVERKLLEDDLHKEFPTFAEAEIVHFKVMCGDEAPAMRCRPGDDPHFATPMPNLFDVGDGVKPDGWTGTGSCALSANFAVEALLAEPVFAGASSGVSAAVAS